MPLVQNKHTASLGLPGVAVALGGIELQPGDNQVDDKVWAAAKDNDCVKVWLSAGLIIVPEVAPIDPIVIDDSVSADEAPKARRR